MLKYLIGIFQLSRDKKMALPIFLLWYLEAHLREEQSWRANAEESESRRRGRTRSAGEMGTKPWVTCSLSLSFSVGFALTGVFCGFLIHTIIHVWMFLEVQLPSYLQNWQVSPYFPLLPQEERRVIYVGKIRPDTTRMELRDRFEVFGEIEECTVNLRDDG